MASCSRERPGSTRGERSVIEALQGREVLTLEEMMGAARVSHVTVFQALGKWGYCRSYNRNGRYYALSETVRFDARGLWRCAGAGFSVHGSLTSTLRAWVERSTAGWTAGELAEALDARVQSSLRKLWAVGGERRGGQYVYFAAAGPRGEGQRARREAMGAATREAQGGAMPGAEGTIAVLLDRIAHPKSSLRAAQRRLKRGDKPVSTGEVRAVWATYELDKKRALWS